MRTFLRLVLGFPLFPRLQIGHVDQLRIQPLATYMSVRIPVVSSAQTELVPWYLLQVSASFDFAGLRSLLHDLCWISVLGEALDTGIPDDLGVISFSSKISRMDLPSISRL